MIRLHVDTNGISLNERPTVRPPPLTPCIPVYSPPPSSCSLFPLLCHPPQLVSDTSPSLTFICSIVFIDLFYIVLDRLAAMIRSTHLLNWMGSHYSWQVTHSVINMPNINQYYHDWSQMTVTNWRGSKEAIKISKMRRACLSNYIWRNDWALLFLICQYHRSSFTHENKLLNDHALLGIFGPIN